MISPEQTGYIRNRFIGTNARLIEDVIEYCDKFNKGGILLFLDFQKAFDTVEWNFIERTLHKFNFGNNFIQWFKTLYFQSKAKIKKK